MNLEKPFINDKNLFLLKPLDGFSPHISVLVGIMNYARWTTFQMLKNIDMNELDYLMYEDSNSIGMLLAHMADVERVYQIMTFENREPSEAESLEMRAGGGLGDYGRETIKGHTLDFYIDKLEQTRQKTVKEFANRDDDWLFEESDWWFDKQGNNYFKWFHVFEDEINHRGQIRIIRKRFRALEAP